MVEGTGKEATGKKIAVVGSGITGLSAAWLLHRSGAKVTLYERESSCGGHTLTDDTPGYPVDLGFQVFNLTTYPNFVGLLECLGVESEPSDMSFALSVDGGALEWGSHGLDSIFAQRGNLLSPSFLCMVWDVVRFGREAPEVLKPENAAKYSHVSMGAYLAERRYSHTFIQSYLLPMCAAVWSVPNSQVMQFPVVMLVRFWANHHLLDLIQRPVWRVVKDRSRTYVAAILKELPDVRTSCAVTRVTPGDTAVSRLPTVTSERGRTEEYDAVIMATHSDTTLALLGGSCLEDMARVLEAIPYNNNEVYLHTDASLMPRRRKTWASWNFIGRSVGDEDGPVCVSYWINNLQRLPPGAPDTFVTLNPPEPPAAAKTLKKLTLAHPVYSFDSYRAQEQLPAVQGKGGIYLGGAWCGYGFHEDGLKAGMAAASALGAAIPWHPRAANPKIPLWHRAGMALFDKFARASFRTGHLRIVLPNGEELVYGNADTTAVVQPEGQEWRGRPALSAVVRMFDCSFFWKLIWRHDSGLGESFMDGDFKVDNLGGLMAILVANAGNIESGRSMLGLLNWAGSKLLYVSHLGRSNTHTGSRSNIEQHYDAGNDMYRLFLDETMTYSSGMYRPGEGLYEGQLNKLDALIQKAGIRPEHNVVELGCGWGSLAIRAVQATGCRWTGITLSKQQLEEATLRVKAAGLGDRITLLFCDYRDLPGEGVYDRLLSCEMVEAVGHEHMRSYFGAVSRLLKPGGIAVIQAISVPDARYEAYCASSDFIREHIFPGGHLPSMGAMVEAASGTGLLVQGAEDIGKDYAITLRQWRAAWELRRQEALKLGYPDTFWRKYRFYFAYCEAAFDAGYIHNYQVTWVKGPDTVVHCTCGAAAVQLRAQEAAAATAQIDPAKTDHVMQALLSVYFLLATALASSEPKLLVAHATSSIYGFLFSVVYGLSSTLWPAFRLLAGEAQAWWCANLLHLVHSITTFSFALTYIVTEPRVLDITWVPSGRTAHRADLLICASLGFFAFQLMTIVRYGLFKRRRMAVLHLTLLLALFSAAAYKAQHTALLACTLLSELPSAFYTASKLLDVATAHKGPLRSALRWGELICLPFFQLIPHFLIAASVILHPQEFSASAFWAIAVIGCLYLNLCNVRAATLAYRPSLAKISAHTHQA